MFCINGLSGMSHGQYWPPAALKSGHLSLLSWAYMKVESSICLMLLVHLIRMALSLALDSAGRSMAAKMAIMAITTSSSIRVKPLELMLVKHIELCPHRFSLDICLIFIECSGPT